MKQIILIPSSTVAGFITAYAISVSYYQNDLNSLLDWVITLSLLTIGFGFLYSILLPRAWQTFRETSRLVQCWAVSLTILAAIFFSIASGYLSFIVFLLVGFVLIPPGLSAFQEFLNQKRAIRFITAWMFGGIASFFALGFLQNFYPSFWEFVLLSVFLNALVTLIFEIILEQAMVSLRNNLKEKLPSLAILGLGVLLIVLTFRLLLQYPTLFSSDFFLPNPDLIPVFLGLTILSQSWTAYLLQKLDSTNWRTSSFIIWTKRNLPGLLLASAISISAYALATTLVSTEPGFADNYFDTDSPFWYNFLTNDVSQLMTMRAVHPMALLILRPPVWLISLLLNGDKFHAALVLNSVVGGLCVFLAWSFFKYRKGNTAYALLLAAILGFSNAHLLLSVFLESYIFSAVALLAFVMLLQVNSMGLPHFISVGLLTFGITITNFIQTCIAFLLVRRNIREVFKYVLIVLVLAVLLAFVQHVLYPTSQPFYIMDNLTGESVYGHNLLNMKPKVAISRANVIFRNITLFSVVSPRPLILLEEVGCSFPCFNTIRYFGGRYQYASYIGFGSMLVRTWFALLIVAGVIFAWQLFRSPKQTALQAALLMNIIFNFVLHMNYGDDPMLYSPNWTYAIVLFFGMSFERLADKKWMQIILLVFLTALLFNNIGLFHKILDAILPFRI